MRTFLSLVLNTLAMLVRPHRANPQAWVGDEPEGPGRYVWHAVVTREGEHVYGRGWFATRQEARAALAAMVSECRNRAWGLKSSGIKTARVVRAWRSDAEGDVYGSDWHARVNARLHRWSRAVVAAWFASNGELSTEPRDEGSGGWQFMAGG